MGIVPLPPYPDLSFPRKMDFCARDGQGRVEGELEQFGEFRPSAPDLAHGFSAGMCWRKGRRSWAVTGNWGEPGMETSQVLAWRRTHILSLAFLPCSPNLC